MADLRGHAAAAVNLGVLLEERDDLEGAEQAFRRADERGDATGAFHLAWLLQESGDLHGAEEAYRRAELRGHPAAHANLRMMLGERSNGSGPDAEHPNGNGGGPGNDGGPSNAQPAELAWDALPGAPAAMAAPPPAPAPVITAARLVDPPEFAPVPDPEAHTPVADPEPVDDAPELPEEEPEVRTEAPAYVDGIEPLTTSLAAFQPATEETPPEPEVDHDAADALAAAVAASAASGRTGAGRRGRATRRASAGGRTDPGRSARATPAPAKTGKTRAQRKAERAEGKPRKAGLIARTLAIAIPVAAFAVAFILGAGTRPHHNAPSRLAPASAQQGSATVNSIATVPSPAKLGAHHRHPARKVKSKPAARRTTTATHSTVSSHSAVSPPAVSSPVSSAPTQSSPPPVNGSGGSAVTTNGTGTTVGSG